MITYQYSNVELKNSCTKAGKCVLTINEKVSGPKGHSFENSLVLEYNVDFESNTLKEGYNFRTTGSMWE